MLDAADGHKLRNVLRLSPGDEILLRDSTATAYRALILNLRPTAQARVVEPMEEAELPELTITLAQCLPKGAKMDYVVEKATELGVARILPVRSERVICRSESEARIERWRRLARAAAEQCGAARVPEIGEIRDWVQLLEDAGSFDRVLLPWELAEAQPRALDTLLTGARSVLIIIGPEGGVSYQEVELAKSRGAVTLSLGRRILRTETAGLLAVACARYAAGEV
jgi:16S rRNA (uracil1498-N3)-methyltransferase